MKDIPRRMTRKINLFFGILLIVTAAFNQAAGIRDNPFHAPWHPSGRTKHCIISPFAHLLLFRLFLHCKMTFLGTPPEMEKAADAADTSVLFFSAGANF